MQVRFNDVAVEGGQVLPGDDVPMIHDGYIGMLPQPVRPLLIRDEMDAPRPGRVFCQGTRGIEQFSVVAKQGNTHAVLLPGRREKAYAFGGVAGIRSIYPRVHNVNGKIWRDLYCAAGRL